MITLNKPVLSVCLVGLVLFLIVPVYSHEDSSASEIPNVPFAKGRVDPNQ